MYYNINYGLNAFLGRIFPYLKKIYKFLARATKNHFPFRDAQGHPPLDREKSKFIYMKSFFFGIESTKK